MADIQGVAKQFVDYYYNTFDSDRSQLGPLYQNDSKLTFEGAPFVGVNDILGKLTQLPFQKIQHKIETFDPQPSSNNGSIVILVTGLLLVDQETNPMKFSQIFHLLPAGNSYYVQNDIFRLN